MNKFALQVVLVMELDNTVKERYLDALSKYPNSKNFLNRFFLFFLELFP